MVMKVPHHTVTVHRDGVNVRPQLGVPFDFSPEEVAFITTANEQALRNPVNEMHGQPTAAEVADDYKTLAPKPLPGRVSRTGKPLPAEDDDAL